MSETRDHSFRSITVDGSALSDETIILNYLQRTGVAASRQKLARKLGLTINNVCGRVRSLIDKGLVVVDGHVWSEETERHRELVRAKRLGDAPAGDDQGDLFGEAA